MKTKPTENDISEKGKVQSGAQKGFILHERERLSTLLVQFSHKVRKKEKINSK